MNMIKCRHLNTFIRHCTLVLQCPGASQYWGQERRIQYFNLILLISFLDHFTILSFQWSSFCSDEFIVNEENII